MKIPLVSIILPVYNGANRIKEAIKSVIGQTYTNWELLVVDDGSQDNTGKIVEDFIKNNQRIKYVKNELNFGIQKTLNRGLKESKGQYIARIDDDDIWIDIDKLSKQVEFLDNNPDYVLTGTGVIVVNEKGNELFRYLLPETDIKIRNNILSKNCFAHSSVVFKKDMALSFKGYDESVNTRHIEDYDLWLKLGSIGKFVNLPIYAVKFTCRDQSISSKNKQEQFKKNITIIKKYKNKYPNYFRAVSMSYLRLIIYRFILKLLIRFSLNKITKLYKNNW